MDGPGQIGRPGAAPAGRLGARLGSRLEALARELAELVGHDAVVADPDVTARYRTDWTGAFGGFRALVVRPADAAGVAATLGAAAARGVPVVAQGGNTGLVGGSVPGRHDALVLSTERMDRCGPVDAATGQVTVGAGVTLAALATHLEGSGWRYAVDFGARDSATIGGSVATNAGGMLVFRFGPTRAQVAGLEYVTADGAVVTRLAGLRKDNTGYDLAGLVCGSEGTLAVVTRVRLRLVPAPDAVATAMLGFATRAAAFAAAWQLARDEPSLEVAEYLAPECLALVAEHAGVPLPFDPAGAPGGALLVEAAARGVSDDELLARLAASVDQLDGDVAPAVVAVGDTPARRADLWRCRDDITPSLASIGPIRKFDVSVPAGAVEAFCDAVDAHLAATVPGAAVWWFGHVCDDNLHCNISGVGDGDATELADEVLSLVAAAGGSISAEHGIGRLKASHLHRSRSPVEIAQMRAVKDAFDPDGLLNPGVLLS